MYLFLSTFNDINYMYFYINNEYNPKAKYVGQE